MTMNSRYKQAAKEARYALLLTILYVIGWCVCAYLPDNTRGPMGFPLWFELSCIYFPLIFTLIVYLCIKFFFKDLPLGDNE
ncbi:DUF997 family protein [Haemophilus haemoglobinophilus]|nr:DUF997 family protein [Canicola haemoglobinophilus]